MREGLKLIQLPGRYGYSVTRIGWLRRVSGDEFELLGGRTIARTSGQYSLQGVSKLAAEGMKQGYEITEADELPEEIHRLVIRRALVASEKAWAKHCPKPKGWREAAE
jgi:hypothetical protein